MKKIYQVNLIVAAVSSKIIHHTLFILSILHYQVKLLDKIDDLIASLVQSYLVKKVLQVENSLYYFNLCILEVLRYLESVTVE